MNAPLLPEEITFADWRRLIARYGAPLLLLPIVSAALAYMASFLLPALWEAKAVMQIARLAAMEKSEVGTLIEPPTEIIERMKLPKYVVSLIASANRLPKETAIDASLSWLKVRQLPNTRYLEISVRHPDPNIAQSILAILAEDLEHKHQEKIRTRYEDIDARIDFLSRQLSQEQARVTRCQRKIGEVIADSTAVATYLLCQNVYSRVDHLRNEISNLNRLKSSLETTGKLAPISVSDQPVQPRRAVIAVLVWIVTQFVVLISAFYLSRRHADG